jgi:CMP/dCMP kinase
MRRYAPPSRSEDRRPAPDQLRLHRVDRALLARDRAHAVAAETDDEIKRMEDNLETGDPATATHLVIAIDGPAAAGKSTVANQLAHRLDALFLDTGVIYRTLAFIALEQGVDSDDGARLSAIAESLPMRVTPPSQNDGRQSDVWIGDRDITWAIRTPEVDRAVSAVSAHREVRTALLGLQRMLGQSGRVVMVGRDIGTVVLPDADLKIWLEASVDERARRRALDLEHAGKPHNFAQVRDELAARDRFDADRSVAPMERAPDAIVVESDGMSVDQVVERILEILAEARRGGN